MRNAPCKTIATSAILLGCLTAAALAQSAMIELPAASGLSKFVSGADGKPVTIGAPVTERQSDENSSVKIVSGVRPLELEERSPEPTQADKGSGNSSEGDGADAGQMDVDADVPNGDGACGADCDASHAGAAPVDSDG